MAATINDRTKWEFYAGGRGAAAKWIAGDVGKATPLHEPHGNFVGKHDDDELCRDQEVPK